MAHIRERQRETGTRQHLAQSKEHQQLIDTRLQSYGARPSRLKDAALRLGALNWGMFFAAQPDTPAKLAGFAFAVEHLEIAGYELLKRVAVRAGDHALGVGAAATAPRDRFTVDHGQW